MQFLVGPVYIMVKEYTNHADSLLLLTMAYKPGKEDAFYNAAVDGTITFSDKPGGVHSLPAFSLDDLWSIVKKMDFMLSPITTPKQIREWQIIYRVDDVNVIKYGQNLIKLLMKLIRGEPANVVV